MGKVTLKPTTVDAIVSTTANLISTKEHDVFKRVLNGKKVLPFTVFVKHLFKAGRRKFHLITANYDRLVELATKRRKSVLTLASSATSMAKASQSVPQTLIERVIRITEKLLLFVQVHACAYISLTEVWIGMR